MLPLLRMLPLGAFIVSMAIFALAATPPAPRLLHAPAPARGALIDANDHPEWRQFLLQAAYRRADEIGQLRLLPDRPTIVPLPSPPAKIQPVIVREPVTEALAPKQAVVKLAIAPVARALPPAPAVVADEPPRIVEADAMPPAPVLPPIAVPEASYVRTALALPLPRAPDAAPSPAVAFPILPMPEIPDEPVFFARVPLPPLTPQHTIAKPPVPAARPLAIAGLSGANAAGADDVTGAIGRPVMATLPIEMGETSSTELPVLLPERPPLPRAAPSPRVSAPPKHRSRIRRAAAKTKAPARSASTARPAQAAAKADFFQTLFGSEQPANR